MKQQRNSREGEEQSPAEVLARKITKSAKKREWSVLLRDLFLTMAAVYLLFGVNFGISCVKGNSMEPNLRSGDMALFLRVGKNYRAGDVVIMHNTATNDYIKRVAAVEGDRVSIDNGSGVLMVNNKRVQEDDIYSETYTRPEGIEFPLTVSKDNVFLLGDNREVSKDSREFGVVRTEQIAGKVLIIIRTQSKL